MKKTSLSKRALVISVIALSVWLFWPTIEQQKVVVIKSSLKTKIAEPSTIVFTPNNKVIKPVINLKKINSHDSALLISKAYAAELNFPPYSQPLTNQDFDRLHPNFFNPQSIPVDENGTTVTAKLSKYRFIYPEPVIATLNGLNIHGAMLKLVDVSNKDVLLTSRFEQDENHWYAEFEGRRDFPRQLQAIVQTHVNGKDITIALALKYVDSVATLEGFNPATTQDADMVLQAKLVTREKGFYRIRANLFDANNQPIAHLVNKEKLNKGQNIITLKAHQSVLQGKESPFYLSAFSIELLSPAPGKPTKHGDSLINKYEIKHFSTSSLSKTPYTPSAQELQRLKLLQNMADRD